MIRKGLILGLGLAMVIGFGGLAFAAENNEAYESCQINVSCARSPRVDVHLEDKGEDSPSILVWGELPTGISTVATHSFQVLNNSPAGAAAIQSYKVKLTACDWNVSGTETPAAGTCVIYALLCGNNATKQNHFGDDYDVVPSEFGSTDDFTALNDELTWAADGILDPEDANLKEGDAKVNPDQIVHLYIRIDTPTAVELDSESATITFLVTAL